MTPTDRLAAALAAHRPDLSRWQQQGAFNELRNATAAVDAGLRVTADTLHAQDRWLKNNPDDPTHDEREEAWLRLKAKYEAAWRLYEQAEARVKEAG